MKLNPATTALVVIDVQKGFLQREANGERRNNPGAVSNMVRLLEAFRSRGMPVIHIRHASTNPGSFLRPEFPGFPSMDETREIGDEPVLVKSVNSGFIGTDLEQRLRGGGIGTVVLVGATTNHCVETTTRMAGNLGFDARLVSDHEIEVSVPRSRQINELFTGLSAAGLEVVSLRNKANRLEELFMKLTERKDRTPAGRIEEARQ